MKTKLNLIEWGKVFDIYKAIEVVTSDGTKYIFSVDGIRRAKEKIFAFNYFSIESEGVEPKTFYVVEKHQEKLIYVIYENGKPLVAHESLAPVVEVIFHEKDNVFNLQEVYAEIYLLMKMSLFSRILNNLGYDDIQHMASSFSLELILFKSSKELGLIAMAVTGRRNDVSCFQDKFSLIKQK